MSELSALSPAAQARASTCGSVHRHEERDLVAIDGALDLAVRLARGIQDAVEGERALALAAVGLLSSALVVCLHDRHLRIDRVGREVLNGTLASPLTRDDLLDNITLYWLTNTGISTARLYWENKADFFNAKDISIPYAMSIFPDELYQAPRSWAERAYPGNLLHYNRLDRGGHFAAWEQPDLFAGEMRASFRSLR